MMFDGYNIRSVTFDCYIQVGHEAWSAKHKKSRRVNLNAIHADITESSVGRHSTAVESLLVRLNWGIFNDFVNVCTGDVDGSRIEPTT